MKALLAGYGGIGANVYYPELKKLGYDVDVLDSTVPDVKYKSVSQVKNAYDLAVICTPNFTHEPIARSLALNGTKRIFVDKPGVEEWRDWEKLVYDFEDTHFHLVKNNLYRKDYGEVMRLLESGNVVGVDINWLNKNRIPNPGSWFTDKEFAYGGVSRDLMPHLFCFALKIFGLKKLSAARFFTFVDYRWNLKNITSTDYGVINYNGKYNVEDYAYASASIDNIPLRLVASWKEGIDRISVTLYLKDGSNYEWYFGLCPNDAYGEMLKDTKDSYHTDLMIHKFLDEFYL
jgi:predicted dehydrogenase